MRELVNFVRQVNSMDDLISRKELIEKLKEESKFALYEMEEPKTYAGIETAIEVVNEQPTIQPQGIDKDRLIEELMGQKYLNPNDSSNLNWNAAINKAIHIIKNQPTVNQQPQTGWIPCSRELPKEDGSYLCTYGKYHMGVYRFTNDLYSVDDYDFAEYKYRKRKGFYVYDSEWGYSKVDYVKAWMPLPQPYKESE